MVRAWSNHPCAAEHATDLATCEAVAAIPVEADRKDRAVMALQLPCFSAGQAIATCHVAALMRSVVLWKTRANHHGCDWTTRATATCFLENATWYGRCVGWRRTSCEALCPAGHGSSSRSPCITLLQQPRICAAYSCRRRVSKRCAAARCRSARCQGRQATRRPRRCALRPSWPASR